MGALFRTVVLLVLTLLLAFLLTVAYITITLDDFNEKQ